MKQKHLFNKKLEKYHISKSKYNISWLGHNNKPETRQEHDFYPTPPEAVYPLLKKEKFKGEIWECACGDGAISKILEENNYNVYSSDLIDRGYGDIGKDFLKTFRKTDNIITNPPFKISVPFVYHACNLSKYKVAMFLRLGFLEGVERSELFKKTPLKKVYVFIRRLKFVRPHDKKTANGGGFFAFAWFIWEKNYNGKPTIEWI
tara:strand:+ start:293 stop:904 length:612 start_codon:yes stop_codon:yes gene_type:complete